MCPLGLIPYTSSRWDLPRIDTAFNHSPSARGVFRRTFFEAVSLPASFASFFSPPPALRGFGGSSLVSPMGMALRQIAACDFFTQVAAGVSAKHATETYRERAKRKQNLITDAITRDANLRVSCVIRLIKFSFVCVSRSILFRAIRSQSLKQLSVIGDTQLPAYST